MTVYSLPASLVPVRQRWQEERQDIEFRSVFGSQILQPVPPVWATELEFDDRADWRAGDFKALQMLLAGGNQLEAYDMARPAPQGTMRGTLTLAADVAQGATSMQLVRANDNLLANSEAFDNAAWAKTAVTVTPNALTAPDATTSADMLVETTATSAHQIDRAATLTLAPHSLSAIAKAGTRTRLRLAGRASVNWSVFPAGVFDLVTGTVASSSGDRPATIEALPDGWYHCAIYGTPIASSVGLIIALIQSGTTVSYVGDGSSGLYAWGAKINLGTGRTDYGYNLTLLAGDLLGIGSGAKQQVVMVTQDATSTGQGNITVNFEHPLRNAFSAGQAVTWDKPKALFRLRQNRPGWDYERSRAKGLKLDLVESPYA